MPVANKLNLASCMVFYIHITPRSCESDYGRQGCANSGTDLLLHGSVLTQPLRIKLHYNSVVDYGGLWYAC